MISKFGYPSSGLLYLGTMTVQMPNFTVKSNCPTQPYPVARVTNAVTGVVNGAVMTCGG